MTFATCLMSWGNVLNPFLKPSNAKETGEVHLFPSAPFLPESFANAGVDANGPCCPPAMAQKALSTSIFSDGARPGSWKRYSVCFWQNMEKRSGLRPDGRQWTVRCCKRQRALKKSADEGLGRNPTDRGRSGSKIHLHVDGQGTPL